MGSIMVCSTWYLLPPASSPVCRRQVKVILGDPWALQVNTPVPRLAAAAFFNQAESSMMGLSENDEKLGKVHNGLVLRSNKKFIRLDINLRFTNKNVSDRASTP